MTEEEEEEEGEGEGEQFVRGWDPLELDGSIRLPPPSPTPRRQTQYISQVQDPSAVTLVASLGCSADCESLKRSVQLEVSARSAWLSPGQGDSLSSIPSASSVATLLMNSLYYCRSFPYYSFCLLEGMDGHENDRGGEGGGGGRAGGTGRFHVYNAIGNHERVAAACAGAPGRDMLQPILDRLLSTTTNSGKGEGRGAGTNDVGSAGAVEA